MANNAQDIKMKTEFEFRPSGNIYHPVVSNSAPTWFIRYIYN